MAKTKISQFDAVASNNTDINSVNVAEGCPPSGINNAIREMASLLKKQEVGTDAMTSPDIDGGTIDGATIGASSASTGAFTTISASGNVDFNGELDVDGTTNLDVVDIDGAVDMASTLQVDGAITSSAGATITTADNSNNLTLTSTDADASSAPNLNMFRNSSSPATNDFLANIKFNGRNNNSQDVQYGELEVYVADVTDGSEDGWLNFNVMTAGSNASYLQMKGGTGFVVNEDANDINFRVESSNKSNMFLVDGGEDIVSIGGGASYTVGQFKNTLQIEGTDGTSSSMSITRNTAGTSPPYLQFAKTRGSSVGANTIVQSGDDLGIITWNGADGTNRDTNGAMIRVAVDGTPGENDMPSRMMFSTTADGASTTSERMRIHNGGVVSIPQGIALGVGTANTASNVLDDYEEGTFTATLFGTTSGSGTNVTATGSYVKVGKLVTIGGYFQNKDLSSMSGSVNIGGLPFTSNAEASSFNTGNTALYGFDFTGFVTPYIGNNATTIDILDSRTGLAWGGLAIPASTGKFMMFSITYKTA